MNNSLLPSADDTASKALINTQSAITRVKEIITKCVTQGLSEEETTVRLNKAIALECKRIDNSELREQTRMALVTAARKWHYQLKQTYRILDRNLSHQPLDVDINNLLRLTPFQRQVEYRKILDDGTSPGVPVIQDYQRSIKLAIKAMAAEPPKVVTRKDGKTYVMPLRNRAEMAVRYEANVKSVNDLLSRGVKFAWTSSHPNCSPRCKDFQGRLWSLEGKSGTLDGISYSPINEALRGKNGDGNGIISGYNCRHRLIEYKPGSKPPEDFSEAEIKREYAIDRQQRSYENRIRQMKTEERLLRAAGLDKEASALRKKWRKLTLEYEIYSLEHDRAFYRYRCIVDRTESSERFYLDDYLNKALETGHKKYIQRLTKLKNQFILRQEELKQPSDFVLSTSVQEAESYMSKRAASVSYNGITNIKSLNQINRTFTYLSELYQIKPLKSVNTRMVNKNAFAEANGETLSISCKVANNPSNDEVKLNSSEWVKDRNNRLKEWENVLYEHQKAFNDAKPECKDHFRKKLKKAIDSIKDFKNDLKYIRHNVIYEGREIESIITHEVAHIIAEQNFQQLSHPKAYEGHAKTIRNVYNRAVEEGDIYKISKYALTNEIEFFAECFTVYEMREETLPVYIKEMLEEVLK